ncbi:hypothetical protein [Aureliella helgolandensis]|uniref:Uncharacterized protein n=1 Tax=Aureliella helgolandensis TaxID=2527968 RepID=A0A518GHM7_9BACT|nr:hypothetical protein [Aureliella helgolandensis]QDV28101.1 hypothetical protein Q31a_64960 [Aureliella helgolandensis]
MGLKVKIDQSVLDELVAGSIPRERYRHIMTALDSDPTQWRDCAMTFLEEQAIQEELSALVQRDVDWDTIRIPSATDPWLGSAGGESTRSDSSKSSSTAVPSHAAGNTAEQSKTQPLSRTPPVSAAAVLRESENHPVQVSESPIPPRLLQLQKFTSLAALLLISFTIGWFGSGMSGESGASGGPLGNPLVGHQSASPSPSLKTTIVGDSPKSSPPPPSRQSRKNQVFRIDREIPASLRELERQGLIRIETIDGLMPVELDNGTSAIVPVQQFRIVPTSQSY